MSTIWNWFFPGDATSDTGNGGGSPVFAYVLVGAAVLLIVAMIFGELEDIA